MYYDNNCCHHSKEEYEFSCRINDRNYDVHVFDDGQVCIRFGVEPSDYLGYDGIKNLYYSNIEAVRVIYFLLTYCDNLQIFRRDYNGEYSGK